MEEISLLPAEDKKAESFGLLQKRVTAFAVVLLVITAALTLGTLAFFTKLANDRLKLESRVRASSLEINNLKSTEELLVVTKKKISAAIGVLSGRTDYPTILTTLVGLIPQQVNFSDLKISQGSMVFSGKAKSSADVAGLVSSLVSAEGAKIVSSVTVESLSSVDSKDPNDEKAYSFVMSTKLVGSSSSDSNNRSK